MSQLHARMHVSKTVPRINRIIKNNLFDRNTEKYLIRTNFREALISRFSRFVKNREIKDSLKLGYAKIKHAKFNTLL